MAIDDCRLFGSQCTAFTLNAFKAREKDTDMMSIVHSA
jgi:hypothetical protein